jgi:pimeloyl-ACP methyl ester carboxylesterase
MLLNYTQTGAGRPIILLHGLAGSLRYWDDLVPELSQKYSVIALDLLGFGRSLHPSSVTYNYDTHILSIIELQNQPLYLVGHSTGALLALRLASMHPELIGRLTLISMPIYIHPKQARQDITQGKRLRDLAYYGPTSRVLCTTWCRLLRPASRFIAPLYLPGLPKKVAQDSLLHTWQSYAQTMEHVIMHQHVQYDLDKVTAPVDFIYGDRESSVVLNNFQALKLTRNTDSHILPGHHNIALDDKHAIIELLSQTK